METPPISLFLNDRGEVYDGWDNLLRQLATTPTLQQQLEQAGLLIRHAQRNSLYDAMRDRVIFPIRDANGHPVGLGGRILGKDPLYRSRALR